MCGGRRTCPVGGAGGRSPKLIPVGDKHIRMVFSQMALAFGLGPLASPVGILGALVVLAVIVLVGRYVLSVAWRLITIGIVVVATLYILSLLGFGLGVFG